MGDILTLDFQADELEIFVEDVNEHLQAMESGILRLEQAADPDTINSVFRAAHTLKALAGTVGHHTMADLTHTAENLFDAMREGEVAPTQTMVDDLLVTVDTLKAMRDEIVTQQPKGINVDAILGRLRALMDSSDGAKTAQAGPMSTQHQLATEQADQVKSYREEGYTILEIEVLADTETFAPGARLYQAAMVLMEAGEVIAQQPTLDDLTEEDERLWSILATKAENNAIEELLSDISALTEFQVEPYSMNGASAPATAPAPAPPSTSDLGVDKTVRISVERLDTLVNLVGELVTDRTRLFQIEDTLRGQYGKDGAVGDLGEMAAHFGRVTDQLQEEVMRARMLPISHLFDKFPRIIRDVARAAGKQVNLVIEGETTELDRSIIEVIGDPLIHLLRNAVDHGLELPEEREAAGKPPTGTVRLTAAPVEGQIVITVEDDGQGIDPTHVRQSAVERGLLPEEEATQLDDDEALELIFRPSLSTAKEVTEVSGRGVGMDVVRTNIERLGGSVVVDSEIGRGTTFRVTLPLTLAIVQTMLVDVRNAVYAIPLAGIMESMYLSEVSIKTVKGNPTIRWRESVLPLVDLREFFNHPRLANVNPNGAKPAVVTVAWGKLNAGLVVDRIIGKQEIVVKSLGSIIGEIPGLSGATILGDGRIALIVDVPSLLNAALRARKQGVAIGGHYE